MFIQAEFNSIHNGSVLAATAKDHCKSRERVIEKIHLLIFLNNT